MIDSFYMEGSTGLHLPWKSVKMKKCLDRDTFSSLDILIVLQMNGTDLIDACCCTDQAHPADRHRHN